MDDLLPKLLAFPPQPPSLPPLPDSKYDEAIKHHITALGKITDKALLQQTSTGASALDVSIAVQLLDDVLTICKDNRPGFEHSSICLCITRTHSRSAERRQRTGLGEAVE